MGLIFGAGIGAALGNTAVGVAVGVAVGAILKSYHREKQDRRTDEAGEGLER